MPRGRVTPGRPTPAVSSGAARPTSSRLGGTVSLGTRFAAAARSASFAANFSLASLRLSSVVLASGFPVVGSSFVPFSSMVTPLSARTWSLTFSRFVRNTAAILFLASPSSMICEAK